MIPLKILTLIPFLLCLQCKTGQERNSLAGTFDSPELKAAITSPDEARVSEFFDRGFHILDMRERYESQSKKIEQVTEFLVTDSPKGEVRIQFVNDNEEGIHDFDKGINSIQYAHFSDAAKTTYLHISESYYNLTLDKTEDKVIKQIPETKIYKNTKALVNFALQETNYIADIVERSKPDSVGSLIPSIVVVRRSRNQKFHDSIGWHSDGSAHNETPLVVTIPLRGVGTLFSTSLTKPLKTHEYKEEVELFDLFNEPDKFLMANEFEALFLLGFENTVNGAKQVVHSFPRNENHLKDRIILIITFERLKTH